MHQPIKDIIKNLLPNGSRGVPGDISQFPYWPPDLFAVTAYIAQISDCYCELLDFSEYGVGALLTSDDMQAAMQAAGEMIAAFPNSEVWPQDLIDMLQADWKNLIDCGAGIVYEKSIPAPAPSWICSVLRLLIIADNASDNMGFYVEQNQNSGSWVGATFRNLGISEVRDIIPQLFDKKNWFDLMEEFVRDELSDYKVNQLKEYFTACIMVPEDCLCVQPKAITPSVGCTLRSLSKNLCLLPGIGQTRSRWINELGDVAGKDFTRLNILIIPFPFNLNSSSFRYGDCGGGVFSVFSLEQQWLDDLERLKSLIKELFYKADSECRAVDVVVFPELALDHDSCEAIKEFISKLCADRFVLIISGVLRKSDSSESPINISRTSYLLGGECQLDTDQAKHHRWKLDKSQIETYALDAQFGSKAVVGVWEDTKIGDRCIDYHVFQIGACFATLICEDLARQDPCKTSIQAVGPNLIFALLMDGPQFKDRWPGRYTLGLTEDPGSSVLTVTSLAMVERSNWKHNGHRQTIALWGNGTGIKEIDLPKDHHAVLLCLTREELEGEKGCYTIDHRQRKKITWFLSSVIPMRSESWMDTPGSVCND